jgi:enoyl-CoA hydratase/carnithine racemase
MIPAPAPIIIPTSYETITTTHIKVSHHPADSKTATPIIVVTLNRPEKQNAFTLEMMDDFEKVYPIFDVDERVKVIVLTGAGKTFCAGADLERGFNSDAASRERVMDHRDRYISLFGTYCSMMVDNFKVVAAWHLLFIGAGSRRLLQCKVLLLVLA